MILTTRPEIDIRLNNWSKITKQPPEVFINETLDSALDDWEDYIDALRICSDVDAGRMKVYSLDEVEKHLDELNALESQLH